MGRTSGRVGEASVKGRKMSDAREVMGVHDGAAAGMVFGPGVSDEFPVPRASFDIECRDADGNLKWEEHVSNMVMTVGKTFNLETVLRGSAYTAAWYLVLKGAGTIAVGDTLASHAGWTEVNPYAGSNRPTVTFPAVAAGAVTSNQVSITINATQTVAGAGICTSQPVATTSGTLYNMTDFSTARGVASGDTMNITVNFSIP